MSGLMLNCGLSSNYQSYHFNSMLPMLVRRLGSMASNIAAEDNWHGAIEVVISAPVEKVWAIASDWLKFPRRCSVECAEGENGVPGCVRKVQAHNSSFWVAEKLTKIDHDKRFLTYDLVGGNTGIEIGYRAAFQVSSIANPPSFCLSMFIFHLNS